MSLIRLGHSKLKSSVSLLLGGEIFCERGFQPPSPSEPATQAPLKLDISCWILDIGFRRRPHRPALDDLNFSQRLPSVVLAPGRSIQRSIQGTDNMSPLQIIRLAAAKLRKAPLG